MKKRGDEGLSHSVQDYLKIIYMQTQNGQYTSTVAIATAFGIRSASVTNMLQRLAETQPTLVVYRKHHGVKLTPEGEKEALQIIRRHRLLEQFLYQVLEYPLGDIHDEAERLEHVISPFFVERINTLMKSPAFDPHGHPIPDRDLNLNDSRKLALLSELQLGQKGLVRLITDRYTDFLVYLTTIGINTGTELKIVQTNSYDGTQQVEIVGTGQLQVFSKAISESIHVELV
ncbi:MAG: metal-dependent transcriptional regulator [Anaerolineaceae bacterium]|nr:metal-dependent transcriptional regulator [Anaerolineaceae bacterium]